MKSSLRATEEVASWLKTLVFIGVWEASLGKCSARPAIYEQVKTSQGSED